MPAVVFQRLGSSVFKALDSLYFGRLSAGLIGHLLDAYDMMLS